jgi:hypothetical protein
MYYFLYKTINKINGKFYYGVHGTEDLNDGYLGSGKILKFSIEKYGQVNFYKEIIKFGESYEEVLELEKEIITEELIKSDECYNILGGGGMPPYRKGENHHFYKKIHPTASKWMTENNPSRGKFGKDSISYNKVAVKDENGNILQVDKNDPRYLNGELIHVNKGKITVKDKEGNIFHTTKNDPRYLNGELIHISKGLKRTFSEEEKKIKYSSRIGRKQSKEEIEKRIKSRGSKPTSKVVCPYCGKIGGICVMHRWHFENCKFKNND